MYITNGGSLLTLLHTDGAIDHFLPPLAHKPVLHLLNQEPQVVRVIPHHLIEFSKLLRREDVLHIEYKVHMGKGGTPRIGARRTVKSLI